MKKKELEKLGEAIYIQYLADEHSEYIRKILLRELDNKIELYKEAFIHGYKHGWNAHKEH